jgi:hypothetical protein
VDDPYLGQRPPDLAVHSYSIGLLLKSIIVVSQIGELEGDLHPDLILIKKMDWLAFPDPSQISLGSVI